MRRRDETKGNTRPLLVIGRDMDWDKVKAVARRVIDNELAPEPGDWTTHVEWALAGDWLDRLVSNDGPTEVGRSAFGQVLGTVPDADEEEVGVVAGYLARNAMWEERAETVESPRWMDVLADDLAEDAVELTQGLQWDREAQVAHNTGHDRTDIEEER